MGLFRKKPAGPRITELDAMVLVQLEKAGSDLSEPHEIDNFLYFKDQQTADRAAERLRSSSKSVETTPPVEGFSEWRTKAVVVAVPTPVNIADMRRRMEAVASELKGDYDGWGAPIVPRRG